MRKVLMFSGCAAMAMLSGCGTTTAPSADVGPAPNNYRQSVVAEVKNTFFDPYSIRDASISQPLYSSAVFDGVSPFPHKGWIVCIRANAKNRMGGYTGQAYSLMQFAGDKIVRSLSGPETQGQIDGHCSGATFSPFPEIEAKG